MLECGIQMQRIRRGVGFQLSSFCGCLITHEHKDHCYSIREVVRAGVDCYLSSGTADAIGLESHRLHTVAPKVPFVVGSYTVLPFETQHDAAEPFGFLIQSGTEKVLFVTDSYYLKYRFQGLTHIMVECNYARKILEENIDNGSVPASLRKRIQRSHFELDNVVKFFKANDLSKVREIHLLHVSSSNGDPDLFRSTIQAATGLPVFVSGHER